MANQGAQRMSFKANILSLPLIFALITAVVALLMLAYYVVDPYNCLGSFLFRNFTGVLPSGEIVTMGDEYFLMDFYGSVVDACERMDDGLYDTIYPPLISLYYALVGLTAWPGAGADVQGALATGTYGYGPLVCYVVTTAACLAGIVTVAILFFREGKTRWGVAASVALLFTVPIAYVIERGNSGIICLLFLMLFGLFFDSEDSKRRLVAIICIAVAFNIKMYPVVFLACYLMRRDWKGFICAGVACTVLFFLPFLFFDGYNAFRDLVYSLVCTTSDMGNTGYGQKINLANLLAFFYAEASGGAAISLGLPVMVFLALCMMGCCLVTMVGKAPVKKWVILLLAGSTTALMPTFSYVYNLTFIMPAFVAFLAEEGENLKAGNVMVFVFFVCAFLPIPFGLGDISEIADAHFWAMFNFGLLVYPMSATCLMNSLALAALWVSSCILTVRGVLSKSAMSPSDEPVAKVEAA